MDRSLQNVEDLMKSGARSSHMLHDNDEARVRMTHAQVSD